MTAAHPKRVRILLRILSPLMRLPGFGGLGRTTWLIVSVVALAVFLAGSFLARTTAVDVAAPSRFSWTWWATSLEFHRELQLASLSDAEIESVAVVRTPSGTDRIFIAGRNALLAFSDDAGHTWTKLNYDPLMGGFAVTGKRAPFPDTTPILAPPSQTAAGNANVAKPTTKVPPKTVNPAPRRQQNAAPVYQAPPQQQTAPPLKQKPAASKPAASLSLWPSFLPSVWAAETSPPGQSPTAANQDLLLRFRAAGTTGATASLQAQPPPQGIPAICRADDGALVLVMSGERAAISSDFGETWRATSMDALIELVPDIFSFSTADFLAGKAFPSGKHASRLETGAARLRGRLGDTLLSPQTPVLPADPLIRARAVLRISAYAAWAAAADYQFGSSQRGAANAPGYLYRYYTDAKGSRWLPAISAFPTELRDAAFSVDGSTGYIVGTHGTILRIQNGGASWQPLTREALHPGMALSAATAGGSYWRLPPPWTYPLLVLFVGALAAAIVISAVPGANSLVEAADWITSPERPSHGGVELVTVSDRPLGEDDVDSLGFRGIARGVAGFLRNPKTQLPITLAINGAWGTGKSSLMNLICGELKRAGFRPVWFNAWHHQEDENLLASLLQSVRSEAPPSPLRKGGLGFRLRLGWFRFVRFYPRALAMAAVFIGLWAAESWYETDAVYLRNYFAETSGSSAETKSAAKPQIGAAPAQNAPTGAPSATPATPSGNSPKPDTGKGTAQNDSQSWLDILLNFLTSLHEGSDDLSKKYGLPRFLSVLYLVFQILPAALQRLKAFTVNPASLLHSAAPGVPDKKIEAQTSFRMRFAREFADVTHALGEKHRLVIFVDDLDRCKPTNVAEMMEAINYVTVAGECAFVLGLETEAVRAALGLSFSAMAQEVEPGNPANSSPDAAKTATQEDSAEVERRKRADFARRYVEKLINIEMRVPALDGHRKQALFTIAQPAAAPGDPFERAHKIAKIGRFLEPAAVFLLVLALGWGAGRALVHFAEWQAQDYFKDKEEANAAALTSPAVNPPAPVSGAPQNAAPANPAPATPQTSSGKAPDVLPGEDPLPAVIFRNPLVWAAIAVLFMVVIQLLARVPIPPAKDSQEFTLALSAWGLVAGTGLPTPRSTKRFLNRLRFLAMRQHPPPVQLPGLIKLLLTAKQEKDALQKEEARAAWASAKNPIPEAILVALASLETYAKASGNTALAASGVGAMLEKLSKEAAEAVQQGDFHSTPFLAELGRIGAPVTPSVPDFNDEKAMRDFFHSLAETKGLLPAAISWAAAAAAKISRHLDRYFDLGGGVEFT